MPDRAFLFLFSIVMILAGVGAAVWLVATGQAGSVDGLFMVLVALLTALAFALYTKFLLGRAMQQATVKPAAQPAKAGAGAAAAKPASAAVTQPQA
jgi:hypothetical protein